MAAFSVSARRPPRQFGLLRIDRHDFTPRPMQEQIQFPPGNLALAGLQNDSRLDQGACRDEPHRIGRNRFIESAPFRLIGEDRHQSGRVDHHQRGNPASS
jgi:hypothetical protein